MEEIYGCAACGVELEEANLMVLDGNSGRELMCEDCHPELFVIGIEFCDIEMSEEDIEAFTGYLQERYPHAEVKGSHGCTRVYTADTMGDITDEIKRRLELDWERYCNSAC